MPGSRGHQELTTITPELHSFDEIPCLIVNRFDRVAVNGDIERVHQEDLCQAMGVDPSLNNRWVKYQRNNGGGPGLRETATLLDQYASDPADELREACSDRGFHHCNRKRRRSWKNLSFLHDTPESIELAPLYDTVPTIMFRRLPGNLPCP